MVPAKTLRLPDDYAFDGWGRRIMYEVDQLYTASAGFTTNGITSAGTVTISNGSGLGTKASAVYALLSFGPNGHGAYPRSGGSTRFNAGSVNTDEHTNCNCNSSAAATAFGSTFVQRMPSLDPANTLDTFDDVVAFANRMQLSLPTEGLPASPPQNIWVADGSSNRIEKFNMSGSFLMGIGAGYNGVSGSIGSSGSGNGQFNNTEGVAIDSGGNVWVTDWNNNRVQEFNSSGTYLMGIGAGYQGVSGSIGSSGTGYGQFTNPGDIIFDAGGNIWVADNMYNRMQEFNSSGTFLNAFGSSGSGNGQFSNGTGANGSPTGIAVPTSKFTGPYMAVSGDGDGPGFLYLYMIGAGDAFTLLPSPATVPVTNWTRANAFSPDGRYFAAGSDGSPYINIYKVSAGGGFTKIANPATLPAGQVYGVAFSPNGRYLAVAEASSPYVIIYTINELTDSFTKLANPATIPTNTGYSVAFSPNGSYLAVGSEDTGGGAYLNIYKITAGDTFTKLANPATLYSAAYDAVAFSPDSTYLAAGFGSSPYLTIYKRSGDTFTALSNPATMPTAGVEFNGVAFSPDGVYLAVAEDNSPYLIIYKRSGDTFTKLANPATLPPSYALGVAFDATDTYLAVGWDSANDANSEITYKRTGDSFTALPNLPGMPDWTSQAISFSPAAQNIWVGDQRNCRFQEFNKSGSYLSQFGSCGTGNGQFGQAWGVKFDASGNIWVADDGCSRVEEWNSSGTYLMAIGTGYQGAGGSICTNGTGNGQMNTPTGLAIDASGNIWVAEWYNNRVQEFNSSGTFLLAIGSGYNGVSGTKTHSGSGNGQLNVPLDVAFDLSGNVWVADSYNNRVQEFNSSGTFLLAIGTGYNGVSGTKTNSGGGNGQLNNPQGLAFDASGNIWVADGNNCRAEEFNSSGTYLSQFGSCGTGNGQFENPIGIAFDASGNLWVTDWSNDNVQEFNSSGTFLRTFGSAGNGNGQFYNGAGPTGVAIH